MTRTVSDSEQPRRTLRTVLPPEGWHGYRLTTIEDRVYGCGGDPLVKWVPMVHCDEGSWLLLPSRLVFIRWDGEVLCAAPKPPRSALCPDPEAIARADAALAGRLVAVLTLTALALMAGVVGLAQAARLLGWWS